MKVALFTRAWIEIKKTDRRSVTITVALFARAWIEINKDSFISDGDIVALFARAWIEINPLSRLSERKRGRPLCEGVDWNNGAGLHPEKSWGRLFARAWIEMPPYFLSATIGIKSPSLRGRGLKSFSKQPFILYLTSRPLCEGVDWNDIFAIAGDTRKLSPSLRGRGLKFDMMKLIRKTERSPSLRGRGLKYEACQNIAPEGEVALFARAWIEILAPWSTRWLPSVALFARAWIEIHFSHLLAPKGESRPLCEGVDWNKSWTAITPAAMVALFTRAWIEIAVPFWPPASALCRPLYEGVDWNFLPCPMRLSRNFIQKQGLKLLIFCFTIRNSYY